MVRAEQVNAASRPKVTTTNNDNFPSPKANLCPKPMLRRWDVYPLP